MSAGERRSPSIERVTNEAPFDPLRDLLDVLDLTEKPMTRGTDGTPRDTFSGRSQPTPQGRVFGGQVVAQCLIAAGRSVTATRAEAMHPHSLHATFLQAGDTDLPITFVVERLRDSRSFSARRVHALQRGRPILAMMCSFTVEAGGLDHEISMPEVPEPESLPELAAELYPFPASDGGDWLLRRAVDMRNVDGSIALEPKPVADHQSVWVKATGTLPDDRLLHAAVLTYASDWVILEPVLRRHGIAWLDPRLRVASLDHSMWFHRPFRADEWLLYTQESPSAFGGRGLGYGHVFTSEGTLVVTVAQEGMLRLKE